MRDISILGWLTTVCLFLNPLNEIHAARVASSEVDRHVAYSRIPLVRIRLKELASYENVVSHLDIGVEETVSPSGIHSCSILRPREGARIQTKDDGTQVMTGKERAWPWSPFHFYNNVVDEEERATFKDSLQEPDIFFPGDDFNRNARSKSDPLASCSWSRRVDEKYEKCFTFVLLKPEVPNAFRMSIQFQRGQLDWKGLLAVVAEYDAREAQCKAYGLLCSDIRYDGNGSPSCAEGGWTHQLHEVLAYPDTKGYAADLVRSALFTIPETQKNDIRRIEAQLSKISSTTPLRVSSERSVRPLAPIEAN